MDCGGLEKKRGDIEADTRTCYEALKLYPKRTDKAREKEGRERERENGGALTIGLVQMSVFIPTYILFEV